MFCSLKCEQENAKKEERELLVHLKYGINAQRARDLGANRYSIVIIGDTHFPFCHGPTSVKILKYIEETRPNIVIQIGDLYDFFSQTRFPRSHGVMTPKDEARMGREDAEKMWAAVHGASPQSKLIQIRGNHDVRPFKRMLEKVPELEPFFNDKEIFEFPQVETIQDETQEVVIDGICFMHGHKKFGEHAKYNLMSTVCGHSHTGGVLFFNIRGETLWELNAGYVGDPSQTPLQYNQQRWIRWTHGFGVIDSHGPRFIAL